MIAMEFMRMFIHGGTYLLPDQTQVRALLYNMEGLMLEWIFEDQGGIRQVGVLPNGTIVGYVVIGRDQFGPLYEYCSSDLMIEDIQAA
jgi:hypothetical protein